MAADNPQDNELIIRNVVALKANWPDMRQPNLVVERGESIVIPSLDVRRRVSGRGADDDYDGAGYLLGGFEQMRNVVNIAEVWGIRFDADTVVMDWGVGCGRIASHAPEAIRQGFIGTDVDPVGIEWCREHIDFGQYMVIATQGRFDIPDNSVDLIYSHSVLTHLDEAHQDHWLAELARVLKPGGIMILTFHGLHSSAMIADWAKVRDAWDNFLNMGFVNGPHANPDIADVTPKDYYRDIAHTPSYIRTHWPECGVRVLDIMLGGFGPFQDVAVCTKG